MLSCHGALKDIKGNTDFTFVLAGNPNVGKSSIFNRLTGMGVVTGQGILELLELQLAGKRPVPAEQFARGQRGLVGGYLGS